MRFEGRGVVWDPKANKALCRFKDGFIETTDKRVIEGLKKAGYKGTKSNGTAAKDAAEEAADEEVTEENEA
ncbi:hypothetical protein [Priestia megaterium]|uniref:hypothetical protein n=1 Tax=Priestia megaterium TaxID=1404 RepID=UPI001F1496B9|nr:hypothetical protein [Priestia megaterium]UMZ35557.1 hypothetical protein MGJ28_13060 [Priestia megaterium]